MNNAMAGTTASTPLRWRHGVEPHSRLLPAEVPVALTHNGSAYAVMMATPSHLEDFAIGFAFTEGLITHLGQVERCDIIELEGSVEARLWLDHPRAELLAKRRRRIAGPTGCGLCGIESLEQALRPIAKVPASDLSLTPQELIDAMKALRDHQELNMLTRSVHAAALWSPGNGMLSVREDIGRHNAVDKVVGDVLSNGHRVGQSVLLLTSRLSIELIQKAAALGVSMISAVSAPTDLAVRAAEAAGITLVAIARDDGFEVFAHPHRLAGGFAAR